ncbi:MAG: TonB-dependent receptor [Flavobacteriales bacterium]|nr:TonB-dependent receptor [Flavobacteriales bacterium]
MLQHAPRTIGFSKRTLHWWCALVALLFAPSAFAQYTLKGKVTDSATGDGLYSASVGLKGTQNVVFTEFDGTFSLKVDGMPPYTLVIALVGYGRLELVVPSLDQELKLKLTAEQVVLKEARVRGKRISDKTKQAALTVESMDLVAIREAPSGDFYESLGNLKGVDMTAASFGFKVINTRGFNSTSPVRSLQLIDGVDNQSPGLNFSLGNFLGCSDLDVMKVDIVAGASSAFFGPGAFNGVINMTSKSPWVFPGHAVTYKIGERGLKDLAIRFAEVFKNKEGRANWAFKVNLCGLKANDWEATSLDPTSNSPTDASNPGRYDAVNIYGDENITANNNYTLDAFSRTSEPGLGLYLRRGYREEELVDYDTRNLKIAAALHHKFTDSLELVLASNYSTGSTVYQGDNRYRLKNVQFWQQRIELRNEGKWFLRGYLTSEDAGETYDIFTTGLRLQEATGEETGEWNLRYKELYDNWIVGGLLNNSADFLDFQEAIALQYTLEEYDAYVAQYVADNNALFTGYHQAVLDSINLVNAGFVVPFFEPGTARYDSAFASITSKRFTDGGSLFYDKSKLAHVMGEYRFKPQFAEIIVGGNYRWYMPNSAGTIFRDTGSVVVKNSEFGAYAGMEKRLMDEKLRSTITIRLDKNQNFDPLISPAASLVYTPTMDHVLRVSASRAVRNPTLADQYLYYNVGRAILLGNVEGQFDEDGDSLFTIESFNEYRTSPTLIEGYNKLDYFHVDRVRPEKVFTLEGGYRGTLGRKLYLDLGAYHSWYQDFIGYVIGIDGKFDQATGFPLSLQVYRLAANAQEQVTTFGVNAGLNYYLDRHVWTFNYSWNKLSSGEDDPIIPAFNTPEHKFNIGVTGHDLLIPGTDKRNFGWGLNYKFIQGYTFEGSPQFTGALPTYDNLDVQINFTWPEAHTMLKIGASNLLGLVPLFDPDVPDDERLDRAWNNDVLMVFGGPRVGRLGYIQLIYEFNNR